MRIKEEFRLNTLPKAVFLLTKKVEKTKTSYVEWDQSPTRGRSQSSPRREKEGKTVFSVYGLEPTKIEEGVDSMKKLMKEWLS